MVVWGKFLCSWVPQIVSSNIRLTYIFCISSGFIIRAFSEAQIYENWNSLIIKLYIIAGSKITVLKIKTVYKIFLLSTFLTFWANLSKSTTLCILANVFSINGNVFINILKSESRPYPVNTCKNRLLIKNTLFCLLSFLIKSQSSHMISLSLTNNLYMYVFFQCHKWKQFIK